VTHRPRFTRWLLSQTCFGGALAAAAASYHGHVHTTGVAAIAGVLTVFAAASAGCGLAAWQADNGHAPNARLLRDIDECKEACPAVAMLGTVSGFLVALSAHGDLQQRATGAATALAATFVGIACWLALKLQHRMVARDADA
jgi:hypothetical protein